MESSDEEEKETCFEMNVKFSTYPSTDEWIKEGSPRLAMFRTHTKQWVLKGQVSARPNEPTDPLDQFSVSQFRNVIDETNFDREAISYSSNLTAILSELN